jgi:hypothetical protein
MGRGGRAARAPAPVTAELEIEWGVRWEIDGITHTARAGSLADAHRKIAWGIRHHERHRVEATGYRVVRRSVGPWLEDGER